MCVHSFLCIHAATNHRCFLLIVRGAVANSRQPCLHAINLPNWSMRQKTILAVTLELFNYVKSHVVANQYKMFLIVFSFKSSCNDVISLLKWCLYFLPDMMFFIAKKFFFFFHETVPWHGHRPQTTMSCYLAISFLYWGWCAIVPDIICSFNYS